MSELERARPSRAGRRPRLSGDGREIMRGASLSLGLKALAMVLSFLFTLLIARRYGAEGAGLYGLAATLATMSVTVALLGLDLASVKLVAAAAAQKAWWRVRRLSAWAFAIVLLLSGGLAAALYLGRYAIADGVFAEPGLAAMLAILAAAVVPLTLARVAAAHHRAVKRLFVALVSEAALVPFVAVLLLLAAADASVLSAGRAYAAGCMAAALLSLGLWLLFLWRRPAGAADAGPGELPRALVRSGLPLTGVAVANFSGQWITIYLLGIVGDASDVGVYRVALQIAVLISMLMTANNSIVAPKVAALAHQGRLGSIAHVWRFSTGMLLSVGLPAVAVALLFPGLLLSFFGPAFVAGETALRLLAAGQLANLATGPVGTILIMTGHERLSLLNSLASAALVLLLSLALIPPHGATGAAAAFAIAMAVRQFVAAYLVWRFAGVRFTAPKPA